MCYWCGMTAMPKHRVKVPEYLAWAEAQPTGRFELVRGEIVAMAPERARHNIVKGNAFRVLHDAVRQAGLPCTVFTDGITVVIDDETAYEPDATVQCGTTLDLDTMVAEKPLIVVEVTSPTTERTDAAGKLADYFTVPSIVHYLVVDPVRLLVVHHARGTRGSIDTRIVREGERLTLDAPGLELAAADLFTGT
jgi:Uma2 family endonuclease